jgi:hypothetical protein
MANIYLVVKKFKVVEARGFEIYNKSIENYFNNFKESGILYIMFMSSILSVVINLKDDVVFVSKERFFSLI